MDTPKLTNMNQARQALSKVPEITAIFWITKVLTTGMGEIFSDFLFQNIDPREIAAILGLVGLVVAWILQFSSRRYSAWIYWLAVVMVSIFGTMLADIIHVILGISYPVSTAFFVAAIIVIFVTWYASEKTLSIHSIYTPRRETFYWATVLVTFALGTAAGDLAATTNLGYFSSGALFAVLITLPALAYQFFNLNEIPAFWFAYILTRPLGASFADWMGLPLARGGLGWGAGPVSLVLTIIIVGLVGYLAVTRKDVKNEYVPS